MTAIAFTGPKVRQKQRKTKPCDALGAVNPCIKASYLAPKKETAL